MIEIEALIIEPYAKESMYPNYYFLTLGSLAKRNNRYIWIMNSIVSHKLRNFEDLRRYAHHYELPIIRKMVFETEPPFILDELEMGYIHLDDIKGGIDVFHLFN